MTGEWSLSTSKHAAIQFSLYSSDYTKEHTLFFSDQRRFGTLSFVKGTDKLQAKLASIGPDMLSNPPSLIEFQKKLAKKTKTLAEFLMDQKNISGIGNYIKAEVLYRAKLSPWRLANSLSVTESTALYEAITFILQESYRNGGATLANYRDVLGQAGNYANLLKIYGKPTDPEGRIIMKEETPDKRSTWWVPEVQK